MIDSGNTLTLAARTLEEKGAKCACILPWPCHQPVKTSAILPDSTRRMDTEVKSLDEDRHYIYPKWLSSFLFLAPSPSSCGVLVDGVSDDLEAGKWTMCFEIVKWVYIWATKSGSRSMIAVLRLTISYEKVSQLRLIIDRYLLLKTRSG